MPGRKTRAMTCEALNNPEDSEAEPLTLRVPSKRDLMVVSRTVEKITFTVF